MKNKNSKSYICTNFKVTFKLKSCYFNDMKTDVKHQKTNLPQETFSFISQVHGNSRPEF